MSENFLNETWTDNFPIDYNVAHTAFLDASIFFGILWSILPICFALSGSLLVLEENYPNNIATWGICWLSLLLIFVGCMVMTKYSHDAQIAHEHDYLGPMRVKGTNIYSRVIVMGCNGGAACGGGQGVDDCCFYQQYAVQVELEWGYDWACPQHGKKCTSIDTYEPCTNTACKSRLPSAECTPLDSQKAETETRDCAEMLYRTDLTYPTNYDPRTPPGADFPTWLAFGDCSTCTSRFIVPSDAKIRRLKITGLACISIGLVVWLVLLFRFGIYWWRRHSSCGIDSADATSPLRSSANGTNGYGTVNSLVQDRIEAQDNHHLEEQNQGDLVYNPDFDY